MIYLFLIIFGLGLGSFANALVWRTRQQIDDDGNPKKLSKAQRKQLSITTGRSMCPNCKHQLRTVDLIPLISWLWLHGKCRYCAKPISPQYPIVEAALALLFVVSYVAWPTVINDTWQWVVFINWLIALTGLMALLVYDVRWLLLPNKILYPLSVISTVLLSVSFILGRPLSDVRAIILSVFIGGGLFYIVYQISRGKWIGGGDVKLGLYLGLVLADPWLAFLALFLASVLGTVVAAPLLATKKATKQTRIPFGPFLIAGAIIAMLWGQVMIDWYTGFLQ